MRFEFQGYSDGTFVIIHSKGRSNYAGSGTIRWKLWSPSEGRGVYVTGIYSKLRENGYWHIGVVSVSGVAELDWTGSLLYNMHPYSATLMIEASDDAVLTCEERGE